MRIQMMADHQHVQMLGDRVDRVGRVGLVEDGRTFGKRRDADDVRRVAAAGALGVIGVDGRGLCDRRDGVFHEAGFVDRVGVDGATCTS
jgi:hypothetical protein